MQQYQCKLTHIWGKDNAADVLSRFPAGYTQDEDTKEMEDFAYSVAREAVPDALVPKQVEIASANDPTLQLVCQAIIISDWN